MPLTGGTQNPFGGDFGSEVGVTMLDGDKTVSVLVAQDTLRRLEPGVPDDPVAVFSRYRNKIEEVGSAKYDRAEFADVATVLVTWDDIKNP